MNTANSNRPIWVRVVDQPIDANDLMTRIAHPDSGAHGWFLGVTRRTTQDKITSTLSYEAHLPMAVKELEQIAIAAIETFSLFQVVIVHRIGEVPIGEASVIVGCSSAHRPSTFQALPWIMNRLKSDVPIWKREHYADGSTEWVHPKTESGQS